MGDVKSDLEIAQAAELNHIKTIAEKIGVSEDDMEMYGKYKAKLPLNLIDAKKVEESNLILVTALTPTPAGEGKTTVTIGLTEGLNKIGKQAMAVLREPSLGPEFGIKGGAAGGGYSQVIPMEDINLHFTGDFNAIEKANNLLSAVIDNKINDLKLYVIDKRCQGSLGPTPWYFGDGTFDNEFALNTTYYPSTTDTTNGIVTITLSIFSITYLWLYESLKYTFSKKYYEKFRK